MLSYVYRLVFLMSLMASVHSQVAFNETSCPDEWVHSPQDNICIGVFDDDRVTFEEARTACQRVGADLVTAIYNKQQKEFLSNLLNENKNYWIGIYDVFINVDGEELGEFNAFGPEEGFENGHEYCVTMDTKVWHFTKCHRLRRFMCQMDLE